VFLGADSTNKTTINSSQQKTPMKSSMFLTSLLVASGLLYASSSQVSAQPGGGGGGGGGRGGRGGALTQEQRTQMTDAVNAAPELADLNTKLTAAQKEAVDAALNSKSTDAAVRAKLEAVAKIQTEIGMLHYTKGVKAIAASVTAEQKTQIDAAPGVVYGQLFGTAGGRGGGGGRAGAAGAGGGGRGGRRGGAGGGAPPAN
jgi:Spy/CpxP family protein refolding chaperone